MQKQRVLRVENVSRRFGGVVAGDLHPGTFEVETDGVAVHGELYLVSNEVRQRVEAGEPPGLYAGGVRLADGRRVQGILYSRKLAEGRHPDISESGGCRARRSR